MKININNEKEHIFRFFVLDTALGKRRCIFLP